MSNKPILFSGPMVRALLAGAKTQTRRALNPQPEVNVNGWWHVFNRSGGVVGVAEEDVGRQAVDYLRIAVGDRLYVREHWRTSKALDQLAPRDLKSTEDETINYTPVRYEADGSTANYNADHDPDFGKLRIAMHMPRWASRITLTVTDVRVERLQDISEADAIAEGCVMSAPVEDIPPGPNPQASYLRLWDKINGAGASALNPWVACYSFTVAMGNIDQIGASHG